MGNEHAQELPQTSNAVPSGAPAAPKPLPKRSCRDHGAGMMSQKMDEINHLLAAAKLVHAPGKEMIQNGLDVSTNMRVRQLLGQPQQMAERSLYSSCHTDDGHSPGSSPSTEAPQDPVSEPCRMSNTLSLHTSGCDTKNESSTLHSLRSFLEGGAGREGGGQVRVGAGAASKLEEVHHLLHAARLLLGLEAVAEVLPMANNETNSKLRQILQKGSECKQPSPAGAQSSQGPTSPSASATIVDTVQRVKQLINAAPLAPQFPEVKLQEVEGLVKCAQRLLGPEEVEPAAARTDHSTVDRLRRILQQQTADTTDGLDITVCQDQASTLGEHAATADRVRQMLEQQQRTTSNTAESDQTNEKLLQVLRHSNHSTSKQPTVAVASTHDAKKARKRAKQKARKSQQTNAPSVLSEAMHSDPKLGSHSDSTCEPSLGAGEETFDGKSNPPGNQRALEDPKLFARIKAQLNRQDQGDFVHITSEDIKVETMTDIYRRMQDLMTDTRAKQAQLLHSVISKREQADPIISQIAPAMVGTTCATEAEGDVDELERLD